MPETKKKVKRRYRLLAGKHSEGSRRNGNLRVWDAEDPENNVIETEADLLALNPPYPMRAKFALAEDVAAIAAAGRAELSQTQSPARHDALEHMTLAELRALAVDEEVDVSKLTRKDEIIRAIRGEPAQVQ